MTPKAYRTETKWQVDKFILVIECY